MRSSTARPRGDIVLDAFLGSGTTVIAAERTGRRCCALELDPGNVPGTQHATDRMCCPEAAELSRRRVADARQCALVKRDMAMRVDQTGQDELPVASMTCRLGFPGASSRRYRRQG